MNRRGESSQDWVARQSWGAKGALLLAGCVLATLLSPVLSFACTRSVEGTVGCRVTRHALGVVPYWWTTIEQVVDADSEYSAGSTRQGRSRRDGGISMSKSVIRLHDRAAQDWLEWTTYADVGADGIAIAIDELVAGTRTAPFLGWRANAWTIALVFCGALPFALAMLRAPAVDRRGGVPKPGTAVQRAYRVAFVVGALFALAVWWGSIPAFVAEPLGLPTGWSAGG